MGSTPPKGIGCGGQEPTWHDRKVAYECYEKPAFQARIDRLFARDPIRFLYIVLPKLVTGSRKRQPTRPMMPAFAIRRFMTK
jgi:hypothetical protein